MFMIRWLRYLKGSVLFCAQGGFPERFINLCTQNRIPLWDLKRSKSCVFGTTTIAGYHAIRDCAHRSGVTLKIQRKKGFPFLSYRQKKRIGLLVGTILSGAIILCLSTMIWTIQVQGNVHIPDADILKVGTEFGIERGARRSKLDAHTIADGIQEHFAGKLSWVAVNIDGSHVVIEVRESIPIPPITDKLTPCNIVAQEDGVITKIQLYAGQNETQIGSAVLKGDLLISGVKVGANQNETVMHADGYVFAEVKNTIRTSGTDTVFLKENMDKIRYSLYFFGIRIPFGRALHGENYFYLESFLKSHERTLPIGVFTERVSTMESIDNPLSDTQKQLLAQKRFADAYCAMATTSKILSSDYVIEKNDCVGTYLCEKQIGVKKEIFIE